MAEPERRTSDVAKRGGGVLRRGLAAVEEILDVDAGAGFESFLFFICHRDSEEEGSAWPATTLRFCTGETRELQGGRDTLTIDNR